MDGGQPPFQLPPDYVCFMHLMCQLYAPYDCCTSTDFARNGKCGTFVTVNGRQTCRAVASPPPRRPPPRPPSKRPPPSPPQRPPPSDAEPPFDAGFSFPPFELPPGYACFMHEMCKLGSYDCCTSLSIASVGVCGTFVSTASGQRTCQPAAPASHTPPLPPAAARPPSPLRPPQPPPLPPGEGGDRLCFFGLADVFCDPGQCCTGSPGYCRTPIIDDSGASTCPGPLYRQACGPGQPACEDGFLCCSGMCMAAQDALASSACSCSTNKDCLAGSCCTLSGASSPRGQCTQKPAGVAACPCNGDRDCGPYACCLSAAATGNATYGAGTCASCEECAAAGGPAKASALGLGDNQCPLAALPVVLPPGFSLAPKSITGDECVDQVLRAEGAVGRGRLVSKCLRLEVDLTRLRWLPIAAYMAADGTVHVTWQATSSRNATPETISAEPWLAGLTGLVATSDRAYVEPASPPAAPAYPPAQPRAGRRRVLGGSGGGGRRGWGDALAAPRRTLLDDDDLDCDEPFSNGKPITTNGCGPDGGDVANTGLNLAFGDRNCPRLPTAAALGPAVELATMWIRGNGCTSFEECCNAHDLCYGTCAPKKAYAAAQGRCDSAMYACTLAKCAAGPGPAECRLLAGLFYQGISSFGASAFAAAQKEFCRCQNPPSPPSPPQPPQPPQPPPQAPPGTPPPPGRKGFQGGALLDAPADAVLRMTTSSGPGGGPVALDASLSFFVQPYSFSLGRRSAMEGQQDTKARLLAQRDDTTSTGRGPRSLQSAASPPPPPPADARRLSSPIRMLPGSSAAAAAFPVLADMYCTNAHLSVSGTDIPYVVHGVSANPAVQALAEGVAGGRCPSGSTTADNAQAVLWGIAELDEAAGLAHVKAFLEGGCEDLPDDGR